MFTLSCSGAGNQAISVAPSVNHLVECISNILIPTELNTSHGVALSPVSNDWTASLVLNIGQKLAEKTSKPKIYNS